MSALELLSAELVRAAHDLGADGTIAPALERPRDPAFGDWATNFALVLSRPMGRKPRDLATALVERLDLSKAGMRKAEVAGPGFINFWSEPAALAGRLVEIVDAG